MKILKAGEFLGISEKTSVNADMILSKTAHVHGETQFHAHKNDYFSILLQGEYIEQYRKEAVLIKPGDIVYRGKEHIHKNDFVYRLLSYLMINL